MGDTQTESIPLNFLTQATIRPAFIGFIISMSLNGISIAQSIFYYRSFRRDGRVNKSIVLLVNIAEMAQTLLLSNMFWDMLICNRLPRPDGDASLEKRPENPWQIGVSFAIMSSITLVVQGFFCIRVWRVSRGNVTLLTAISATAIAQLSAVLYVVTHPDDVLASQVHETVPANHWLLNVPFTANILCDGIVAGSLSYYYRSYRTGMPRTEPIMQQLLWLSTSTGILLCLLTALAFILSLTDPVGASSIAPLFIVSKLYVNSMMANLNSRRHFRTVIERTMDYSMHASAFDTIIADL